MLNFPVLLCGCREAILKYRPLSELKGFWLHRDTTSLPLNLSLNLDPKSDTPTLSHRQNCEWSWAPFAQSAWTSVHTVKRTLGTFCACLLANICSIEIYICSVTDEITGSMSTEEDKKRKSRREREKKEIEIQRKIINGRGTSRVSDSNNMSTLFNGQVSHKYNRLQCLRKLTSLCTDRRVYVNSKHSHAQIRPEAMKNISHAALHDHAS